MHENKICTLAAFLALIIILKPGCWHLHVYVHYSINPSQKSMLMLHMEASEMSFKDKVKCEKHHKSKFGRFAICTLYHATFKPDVRGWSCFLNTEHNQVHLIQYVRRPIYTSVLCYNGTHENDLQKHVQLKINA